MDKLDKLLEYIDKGLATANLTLSAYGRAEVKKRWKLPESKGDIVTIGKNSNIYT